MTMKWDLESVLEQSLTQIAAGQARVESCLLAYPAMADELEPLLRSAETLRALPKPVLAPEAKARIEDQLLAAAAANPRLAPVRRPRPRLALPVWRLPRWAVNALTLVLALIVAMTAVVGASADSLPDSALYPVKLATEDTWLWLTPAHSEPRLNLQLARRRLGEIEALALEDKFEPAVLDHMADHIGAALEGASELPPALALPVLDELSTFISTEQSALANVMEDPPPGSQPYLENALLQSMGFIDRVESLRASLSPGGAATSPEPVPTHTPTSAPAIMGIEEPVATATPVHTATLIPTQDAAPTPTWTATLVPTSKPQAPAPTATQPPPPSSSSPPPPPTETQPPPEPTATERVPPGLTKTPEPPGQTKTPKP